MQSLHEMLHCPEEALMQSFFTDSHTLNSWFKIMQAKLQKFPNTAGHFYTMLIFNCESARRNFANLHFSHI